MTPFLSIWNGRPNWAICSQPARTTASSAVVRKMGSGGVRVFVTDLERDRISVDAPLGLNGSLVRGRLHALEHADFHPTLGRAPQLDIVHEVADEKNTTAT